MKGDGNIIVTLKYKGLGYKDNNQAYVKVFFYNNIIYEGITYNGELCINLDIGQIYVIEATFHNEVLRNIIYVNQYSYNFVFYHNLFKRKTITFSLKDYYYNIPIKKGELFLWQKM